MEALPVELADNILDLIFRENPQNLYQLRVVSKTWKDLIDRCTSWLLKVWCAKCLEKIPEICLDDIVHTKFPQFASWQEYCSNKVSLPHIARDIYESRNEFPNLVGKLYSTEIGPKSETEDPSVSCFAVNDKYIAISSKIPDDAVPKDGGNAVRIYSIDDLTHYIRKYPFSCGKMDFYETDNRVFIVLEKSYNYEHREPIYLAEFLVDDRLVLSNLPSTSDFGQEEYYVITGNQCFTADRFPGDSFQHQKLISNGLFEISTNITIVPPKDYERKSFNIDRIQIHNSTLFITAFFGQPVSKDFMTAAFYQYQITRQPNGKLSFSDPQIYKQNIYFSREEMLCHTFGGCSRHFLLTFAVDNMPVQEGIYDIHPRTLDDWMYHFFHVVYMRELVIHANHVLIPTYGQPIIFRGNVQQLMDYAAKKIDPGSRCTVIKMDPSKKVDGYRRGYIRVIRGGSKPKFFIRLHDNMFIKEFIP